MWQFLRKACAVVAFFTAWVTAASADHAGIQQVDRDLEGWRVGNFTLLDHNGGRFTQEQLDDRWTFVLFGGAGCAQSCAAALAALTGMYQRIATTEVVKITQVLLVSLDSPQGAPHGLRQYLTGFDRRFIGASGNPETLERLLRDLSPPGPDAHAARRAGALLLIGPDRYVRGEFLPPYDAALLTARFLKIRIGR